MSGTWHTIPLNPSGGSMGQRGRCFPQMACRMCYETVLGLQTTPKSRAARVSTLNPTGGGAYSTLADPIAGGEVAGCPRPMNPIPLQPNPQRWPSGPQTSTLRAFPPSHPLAKPLDPPLLSPCWELGSPNPNSTTKTKADPDTNPNHKVLI